MKSAKYIGVFTAAAHILLTGCSNNIEGSYLSTDSKFRLEISQKQAKISSVSGSTVYEVTSAGWSGFTLSRPGVVLGFNRQIGSKPWYCDGCFNHELPDTWEKQEDTSNIH